MTNVYARIELKAMGSEKRHIAVRHAVSGQRGKRGGVNGKSGAYQELEAVS
jgi:hypothetical protein